MSEQRRPASLPDDLNADLADRLLLALGIQPRHAEEAGYAAVIEAAVHIRTDAHRYPMAVEDWSLERDRREELEPIVRDLANAASRPDGSACKFCGKADDHTSTCIWVRARQVIADECTACGGLGDCVRCDGDGCGADPPADGYCYGGTCPHCAGTGIEPFASDFEGAAQQGSEP